MPSSFSGLSQPLPEYDQGHLKGWLGGLSRCRRELQGLSAASPRRADRKLIRLGDRPWSALQTRLQGVDRAALTMVIERDHAALLSCLSQSCLTSQSLSIPAAGAAGNATGPSPPSARLP